MSAAPGPPPPRIPAGAAVAVSAIGAFLVVTLLLFVGLGIFYSVADHYYDREHDWLSPDGILRNFKIAFYCILSAWMLAVPAVAYAAARWLRAPRAASVLLSTMFLMLAAGPLLQLLSFSNNCQLGESFPFPDTQC
jgi:uncharacterized membrane protein SirB2